MSNQRRQRNKLEELGATKGDRIVMSAAPIEKFRAVPRAAQEPARKPKGLWYACGFGWYEFMEDHGYLLGSDTWYIYKLEITSDVCRIGTEEDLDNFTSRYAIPEIVRFSRTGTEYVYYKKIDWPQVAKRYAGVEICPYLAGMSTRYMWYDGWDVASGCIWDTRGVESLDFMRAAVL